MQCVAVCCSVLQCVAVHCNNIQHTDNRGPRCSVLQCVAVCCSVLQCVAVHCNNIQHTDNRGPSEYAHIYFFPFFLALLQYICVYEYVIV